ncbi:MAG TPA: hypothetical protein VGM29_08580 [Polyangiaceae bacterium]
MSTAARRIVIKGGSGSGKSTLAVELARRLNLPHVELDALHWDANWRPVSGTEFEARVAAALDDTRGWVVDGNYDSQLGGLVLERAQLIVWLDLPLGAKLWRLVGRTSRRILQKEELWNGNRESLQGALWGRESLFWWTVTSHFRHGREWPMRFARTPFVRLRTPEEVRAWLATVTG